MNTGKRLSHIKPWRGCQFCRQSKVWCDEGRPACRNCVKYRRVCLYGPPTDTKGQQLPHAKQSPPDTRPLPGSQSSTFPLEKDDSASHTTLASASITPSLDPYSQSLLPLSPARRALLAFYTEEIIPEVFPIPAVNRAWNQTIIPQAFIEPALLYALLGITSSTLKLKHVKPFNPAIAFAEVQSHKVASISLINRKLQNVLDATQLSTILTVVTLLGSELAADQDSDAIQIHLKGLRDIINLRGGFDGLPIFLIQVALFADLGFAATRRSLPSFPMVPMKTRPPKNKLDRISGSLLGVTLMTVKDSLDPHMTQVYRDLSVVVAFRESCSRGIDAALYELEYFETLALRVQHHLITFLSTRLSRKDTDIQSICRVTVPIFVIRYQFVIYGPSMIMDSMAIQLYEVLSSLDLTESWKQFPSILAWAFMFGIWISREKCTRDWFLFRLAEGSNGILRWQWTEIREILQKLFYVDRLHGADFERICEEVRLLVPHAGRM
ncbi:hypothetical protein IMSHALPRED_001260 [Imshaugia aleurites]|uniref:Zn(2)-C6 fungal-type domain-containing protein n=1 Tax=Imshaugia aleurites TaxID=172621 RepID=A0A8H3PE00_9LECA|nr:hypothetical protein IMSHALPRED_001260 [Imshaugia aleurites]